MGVIVGIDGCRAGWLCLTKDLATGAIVARILPAVDMLLTIDPRPQLALIDVPIGLPDSGSRECDIKARAHLKAPRSSSVFPAPVRPVLAATSYSQACEIGQKTDGRKLSRQAWAILPKIREVDSFVRSDPKIPTWVREIHPEVCFWAWNDNKALTNSKKSLVGRAEREALVRPLYGSAYTIAQLSLQRGQYANDDLLDAFAALWSAERVISRKAIVLPAVPPLDSCGLRMEMVA